MHEMLQDVESAGMFLTSAATLCTCSSIIIIQLALRTDPRGWKEALCNSVTSISRRGKEI